MVSAEQLDKIFTYHPPKNDQAARYQKIRKSAILFACDLVDLSPESSEQIQALNKIQEAVMWANAAIARNE
jgi:hypothetical protein